MSMRLATPEIPRQTPRGSPRGTRGGPKKEDPKGGVMLDHAHPSPEMCHLEERTE